MPSVALLLIFIFLHVKMHACSVERNYPGTRRDSRYEWRIIVTNWLSSDKKAHSLTIDCKHTLRALWIKLRRARDLVTEICNWLGVKPWNCSLSTLATVTWTHRHYLHRVTPAHAPPRIVQYRLKKKRWILKTISQSPAPYQGSNQDRN